MASIADVYITILPETSKIAPAIKKALKEAGSYKVPLEPDTEQAKKDTERWRQEESKKPVKPPVKADTVDAEAELIRFRLNEERKKIRQKIEFDESNLRGQLSTLGKEFDGVGAKFASAFKWNTGLVGVGLLPSLATSITNVAGALQQLAGAGFAVPGIFAGLASSVGTAALGMAGMKDAIDAVNKAADGTQASVDAANAALAGLSPNAADAVKTIVGLKGTFEDLRNIASQNLFAGFSDGLKGLISESLPEVTNGINQISHGLNQNLLQVMKSLGSDSSQGFLDRIFGNTGEAQHRLTAAIDPIIHAVGLLSATGSDVLPRLADAIGKVADRFDAFITKSAGNGNLTKWINDGLTGFTDLGNTLLNIGKSFTALTQAAGGDGGLLKSLRELTENMSTFLNSAEGQSKLSDFFEKGRDQLGQLRDIAKELGPVLGGVFNAGLSAANMWLPVIREVLRIINSIPGGAQAVVTAFVAWKTIQGPVALASAIANIANLLKVTLPNAAASGAAAASSSLGRIASALGPIAALVGSVMAITGGKPLDYITGDKSPLAAGNDKDWAKILYGNWAGGKINDLLGTGPQPLPQGADGGGVNSSHPLGVGIPGGLRTGSTGTGLGANPGFGGMNSPFNWGSAASVPAVDVPGVSSYTPPIVTEAAGGGTGSGSGPMGVHPQIAEIAKIAREQFGLELTSGKRDEAGSFHNTGEAGDFSNSSGNSPQELAFAQYMAANYGSILQELIYSDPNFNQLIGGGKNVTGTGYYSAGTLSEHQNHVHIALKDTMAGMFTGTTGSSSDFLGGGIGSLTQGSSKDQIAAAIIMEAQKRGFNRDQTVAVLSTALQESGLNPGASGGGGAWHGIFQQDKSYPGRDNPNTNIGAFFDRLGAPSGDIWGQIFALQQGTSLNAPGARRGYLSEIMGKGKEASNLLDKLGPQIVGGRSDIMAGGTRDKPLYTSSVDNQGEKLGNDIVSGIAQVFGLGDLFKDPTQFGLFKIFKAAMGLNLADDQGGAGQGGGGMFDGLLGGGGGGGILSSLMGLAQKPAAGTAESGNGPGPRPGPADAIMPTGGGGSPAGLLGFMSGLTGGVGRHAGEGGTFNPNYLPGGGNFNPGIQIDTSHASVAPPYTPSPFGPNIGASGDAPPPGGYPPIGGAGGTTFDFRGANFGHDAKAVQNQVNSAQLQQTRQPLRALPSR